jgi:GT2 family glycosyltransferase/glycosyltransferase involved in cell wall biosynthesis/SAM-dependent methyltransferase
MTGNTSETAATLAGDEKEKWNAYYASLGTPEEDEITRRFNAEFCSHIDELLPDGGRILEAGCGGGWQSLALARSGRFQSTLLDFSPAALSYAASVFAHAGLHADCVSGDLVAPGAPEYDLVFNSGVLEHYPLEEQAAVLRGMASRSRRYVLVLVPNTRCYWYWIWRLARSSRGDWPWGKEVPSEGLTAAFDAAGISLLGHTHMGESWTESFISTSIADPILQEQILSIHRSRVVPIEQRAYLVAALGSVKLTDRTPPGWSRTVAGDHPDAGVLSAAIVDALAARPATQAVNADQWERAVHEKNKLIETIDAISAQIAELQEQRRKDLELIGSVQLELAGLRGEKQILAARAEQVAEQLAGQQAMTAARESSFQAAIQSMQAQANSLVARNDDLRLAADRAQEQLDVFEKQDLTRQCNIEKLSTELAAAKAACLEKETEASRERSLAQTSASQFEALRRRFLVAGNKYDTALRDSLEVLRTQRAWRIMLAVRKAYTLWTARGLRQKLSSLKVPVEAVTRSHEFFSEYDLTFPRIWDYLPEAILQPGHAGATAIASKGPARFDVIILPVFDFEFRFQRPQQIASGLARAGHRVFWVSPSRFLAADAPEPVETVQLRENLYEVRLRSEPVNLYTGKPSVASAEQMFRALQHLYRSQGLAESAVIAQFPFWRQLALDLRTRFGARMVYDCMDDWRNWTAEPRISKFSLDEEHSLARECDVLAATSASLQTRLELESERKALRLRNAVDYDVFRAATPAGLLARMPRPIVGYYGAIADWVDIDLLVEVVAMRPQYSFVFIGEVHQCDVSALKRLPNVHLLGEKHYSLIGSYLRDFDVCLLPFARNQLTQAVDPVKVYEYLSQGKPVVATPLPEVRDHGSLVYLADNAPDFAAQIDAALAETDTQLPAARTAHAAANTWDQRVELLSNAIAETFPLVSIIVVSYNSKEYLQPFLESLECSTGYPHYEVIVVDNNSSDGSQDFLRAYAELHRRIRLVLLDTNAGFAGGNNLGVREAQGEYLVLLNPDTILTWGWLDRLLRPLRADPAIGMTAPVTNFSGNQTKINTAYRNFTEMEQFARDRAVREFGRTFDLGMAPLLCVALPRRVWEDAGELDVKFGIGTFEDDDFCLRVRQAGYRIAGVEDCFIHHFGNGSFRQLPHAESARLFEQNRNYFEAKWQVKWMGHKTRSGVLPPNENDRVNLSEFFQIHADLVSSAAPLTLRGLFPERIAVGQLVNTQPDGSSALVVACENATPGTMIRFGGVLLQTAYGSDTLLSATLPADFNALPGNMHVTLENDLAQSNTLFFTVEK